VKKLPDELWAKIQALHPAVSEVGAEVDVAFQGVETDDADWQDAVVTLIWACRDLRDTINALTQAPKASKASKASKDDGRNRTRGTDNNGPETI
jgi:hypothetical protein